MLRRQSHLQRGALMCCAGLAAACGSGAPEPPLAQDVAVIKDVQIAIDADNNCSMASQPVECSGVAAAIRRQYPTSTPVIHVCPDRRSRYEASAEVMESANKAGFMAIDFNCAKSPASQ